MIGSVDLIPSISDSRCDPRSSAQRQRKGGNGHSLRALVVAITFTDARFSFDSYPYVCILMLSHTSEGRGGHTYIRTGDGQPRKVSKDRFCNVQLRLFLTSL